jgi:6-phosphogluconolactonase
MEVQVLPTDADVARRASELIEADARAAIGARGKFTLAVSGGRTPWAMLSALASRPLQWDAVHLFQVDERVAMDGDEARNLTHISDTLLAYAPIPRQNVHAMPVTAQDLPAAAKRYAAECARVAGTPVVFDLVHLGLGPDGHTASLVPGDPVLNISNADVAITEPYQGHARMTLTYPAIDRARRILWLVTGAEKHAMYTRLRAGDRTIPAGRVRDDDAFVIADRAAAGRSTA